jgi:hypothetical protein
MTEAGPSEPLQHEPLTEQMIPMMDYAATQAQSLGPLLPPRNQSAIDEVDRLYHQVADIKTIGATQLAECARWRHLNTNPSLVRFKIDRRSPDGMPSAIQTAPPPSVDFSPKLRCGSKAYVMSPWHTGNTGSRAHAPNGACGTHIETSPVNGGVTTSTLRG